MRICALHFESHCLGKHLTSTAVPTLHLAANLQQPFLNPPLTQCCCLPHCRKTRQDDHVELFRFPLMQRSTLFKWCHNLQLPLSGNTQSRLCSVHFEPQLLSKRSLAAQAVPTLQLNAPPGYKLYQNAARASVKKVNSVQMVCILPSCRNTRADGCKLFRFPQNRKMLRQWTQNIRLANGNEALRCHYRICSRHFEPNTYGSKRLHPGAVPTLELGHTATDIYPTQCFSLLQPCCVVRSCLPAAGERFFKFPSDDEALLLQWCENLQLTKAECVGARICSRHFAPECIGVRRLLKWATPTLELGDKAQALLLSLDNKQDLKHCCVPACNSADVLFDFPQTTRLFHVWRQKLQLPELLFEARHNYSICRAHFATNCFQAAQLKLVALPTLKLCEKSAKDDLKIKEITTKQFEEEEEADDEQLPVNAAERCHYAVCNTDLHLMCLFALPETRKLREIWLQQRGVKGLRLCGLHFADIYEATLAQCEALLTQNWPEFSLAVLQEDFHRLKEAFLRCQSSQHVRAARCCLPHCRSNNQQLAGPRLYAYPLDTALSLKWCHNLALNQQSTNCLKVCAKHFESHCFTEKQHLRQWALPTLQLPAQIVEPFTLPDLLALWCTGARHLLGPLAEKCCVSGCPQATGGGGEGGGMRYYNFPTELSQLQQWAFNLQMEPAKCPLYKVCAAHFEGCCFVGARLRCTAMPTLQLHHLKATEQLHQNPSDFKEPETKIENDLSALEPEQDDIGLESTALQALVKRSCPTTSNNLFTPRCCVPNCGRQRNATNSLRTFGYPSNQQLYRKWCSNLHYEPSTRKMERRVCIAHFQQEVIGQRKLKSGAVPTINLGHNFPAKYNNNALLQELDTKGWPVKLKEIVSEEEEEEEPELIAAPLSDDDENEPCDISAFLEVGCEETFALERPVNTWSFCSLVHCGKVKTLQQHLPTFAFPKDKRLLHKWCINLQLDPAQCFGRRICIDHFEPHVVGTRRLRAGAVPTLNLGYAATPIYTMNGWSHKEQNTTEAEQSRAITDVNAEDCLLIKRERTDLVLQIDEDSN